MFRESENRPLTISCKKKKRKKERRIPHTGTIDRINNENVPSTLCIVEDPSTIDRNKSFWEATKKVCISEKSNLNVFQIIVPSNTDIHRVKETPTKRSKNNSTR